MTNKVTEAIDEMVREKTFSLDALNAINDLKAKAKVMEAALETSREDAVRARTMADSYQKRVAELADQVGKFEAREKDITARELKVFENEKTMAVAQARGQAYAEAFSLVFRNTVTRESINKNVSQPSQNGMMMSSFEGGTVERTTE